MSGAGTARLVALAERLTERDREVVRTVARLRLISGRQLERLFFTESPSPSSAARLARLSLARLVELGLLARLDRRVGGVRAGSAGFVYAATPDAQRLSAFWRGEGIGRPRAVYEPGAAYVAHTLAAAEVFVLLKEAEQVGRVEVLAHQAEPDCWRQYVGAYGRAMTLRPDAYVQVAVDDFEEYAFIEVDRGTVGRTALRRKHDAYLAYYRSGREQAALGLMPRVIWLADSPQRVRLLADVAAECGREGRRLFAAMGSEQLVDALCGSGSGGSA